jgi:hypothetical protein
MGSTAHAAEPMTSASAIPTGTEPVSSGSRTVSTLLGQLEVRPEKSSTPYRRDLYRHWIDEDGDGCDTRREVLRQESSIAMTDCRQSAGDWTSVYDGESVQLARQLDVDHVVALAEAHRSGADRWDVQRRTAYANDLGSPWSLVAVTASSNRSKSDRDPARWTPNTQSGRCFLAQATVITKWRWALSVDREELNALRRELRQCPSLTVTVTRVTRTNSAR